MPESYWIGAATAALLAGGWAAVQAAWLRAFAAGARDADALECRRRGAGGCADCGCARIEEVEQCPKP